MDAEGPLEHRGWGWVIARCWGAVCLSMMMGGAFGALNAVGAGVVESRDPMSYVLFYTLYGTPVGGIIGLICSPLLMLVAVSRESKVGCKVAFLITSAASLVSGLLGHLMVAPVVVYAGVCIAWILTHGRDVYVLRPGHCPQCRYDLRGLAPGVCPECGTRNAAIEGS